MKINVKANFAAAVQLQTAVNNITVSMLLTFLASLSCQVCHSADL